MRSIKGVLIQLCLIIFFAQAVYTLLLEGSENYHLFKKYRALSDDQKRSHLIGERFRVALKCGNIIPLNANILYLSNFTNNHDSFDLFLNYYLYPRKLYLLNSVEPYPESPPAIKDIDRIFLSRRNINWIIFNYPREYGVRKLLKLNNDSSINYFELD